MKILALLVATVFVIAACSESTTNPPSGTTKTYTTSATGAFVVNRNVDTVYDEDDNASVVPAPNDSVVVVGTQSVTDDNGATKTAIVYVRYVNGVAEDTTYMAEEGAKLYLMFGVETDELGSDIALGRRWVLIGDQNGTTWAALEQKFTGVEFDFNGTPVTAEVTIKVEGSRVGTGTTVIDGKTVNTIQYRQTVSTSVSAVVFPGLPPVSVPFSTTANIWYGENIGVVKAETPSTTVNVPAFVDLRTDGSSSTAIRYGTK